MGFSENWSKLKNSFNDNALAIKAARAAQGKTTLMLVGAGLLLIMLFIMLAGFFSGPAKKIKKTESRPVKITTAGDEVDGTGLRINSLEDNIDEQANLRKTDIGRVKQEMQDMEMRITESKNEELQRLRDDFHILSQKMQNMQEAKPIINGPEQKEICISSFKVGNAKKLLKHKDIYLAPVSNVPAVLLNGVAVSTSVNRPDSPDPIAFRLVDYTKLPSRFQNDLKDCRVLGSTYGDISSERAVVRLEALSCVHNKTQEVIETKISGYVVGSDGVSGIKGEVVSMDRRHLTAAAIGGILSGFSKTAESSASAVSSLGVRTEVPHDKSSARFKQGAYEGAASSADKLAEYYLKKAESISPVIQVPAGQKIDLVFTKGVFIGTEDVKQEIARERAKSEGKLEASKDQAKALEQVNTLDRAMKSETADYKPWEMMK